MTTVTEVAGAVGIILAALGAVGVAVRKLWRVLVLAVKAVETIQKELKPNGGGSTYDLVRKTRADLDELRVTISEVEDVARLERGMLGDTLSEVKDAATHAVTAAGLAVNEAKAGRAVMAEAEQRTRHNVGQLRDAMASLASALVDDRHEQARTRLAYLQQLQQLGVELQPVGDDAALLEQPAPSTED